MPVVSHERTVISFYFDPKYERTGRVLLEKFYCLAQSEKQ